MTPAFHVDLMVATATETWSFGGSKVRMWRPEEAATSKQCLASNQPLSLPQNKFVLFHTQFHHLNILPISSGPFQIFSSKHTQCFCNVYKNTPVQQNGMKMASARLWCPGVSTSLVYAETVQKEVNDGNILLARGIQILLFCHRRYRNVREYCKLVYMVCISVAFLASLPLFVRTNRKQDCILQSSPDAKILHVN